MGCCFFCRALPRSTALPLPESSGLHVQVAFHHGERISTPDVAVHMLAQRRATANARDGRRVASICLSFAAITCVSSATTMRPSIMFILADDMGMTDIRTYFDDYHPGACDEENPPQTPNLDALALGGVRLDNFRVMSAICSPSRVSFMTGMFSTPAGFPNIASCFETWDETDWYWDYGERRSAKQDSIPRMNETDQNVMSTLQSVGYITGHFGKWHVGCDTPFGPGPAAYGLDNATGWSLNGYTWREYADYDTLRWADKSSLSEYLVSDAFGVVDTALRSNAPWFVSLNPAVPHSPLSPRQSELAQFAMCDVSVFPFPWDESSGKNGLKLGSTCAEHVYKASVFGLDERVGDLVTGLRSRGVLNDTLIVFTADNGPENSLGSQTWSQKGTATPWRGFKRSLYEGGIRVPFIAHWPNQITPGRTTRVDMAAIDWLPTVAALVGVPLDRSDSRVVGRDARSVLTNGTAPDASTVSDGAAPVLFWEWGYTISGDCNGESPRLAAQRRDSHVKLLIEPSSLEPQLMSSLPSNFSVASFFDTYFFVRAELYDLSEISGVLFEQHDLMPSIDQSSSDLQNETLSLAFAAFEWARALPRIRPDRQCFHPNVCQPTRTPTDSTGIPTSSTQPTPAPSTSKPTLTMMPTPKIALSSPRPSPRVPSSAPACCASVTPATGLQQSASSATSSSSSTYTVIVWVVGVSAVAVFVVIAVVASARSTSSSPMKPQGFVTEQPTPEIAMTQNMPQHSQELSSITAAIPSPTMTRQMGC